MADPTLTEIIDWLDELGVPFAFAGPSDSFHVLVCRHENTRWQADAVRYFHPFSTFDSLARWAIAMGYQPQLRGIGEPSSSSASSTPESSSSARPASVKPIPPATVPPPIPA